MAQATQMQAVRVLSPEEVLTQLRSTVHAAAAQQYFALYSSILGGVVTDPALMVIPFDDHMVHRGHAVFDTAAIVNGMMYQLIPLRLVGSAKRLCVTGRRSDQAALAWRRTSASAARFT
jgi:hypothetical protein